MPRKRAGFSKGNKKTEIRVADFNRMMASASGKNMSGYNKPGSHKKPAPQGRKGR